MLERQEKYGTYLHFFLYKKYGCTRRGCGDVVRFKIGE